jgi:hypothetical protein
MDNNIAEEFERRSGELIHFLYIERGSCGEGKLQLYRHLTLSIFRRKN